MCEDNLRNVSVQNIADNHSIAHSLLCVYMQCLNFVGKSCFVVLILLLEKNVNIPFRQMCHPTFI